MGAYEWPSSDKLHKLSPTNYQNLSQSSTLFSWEGIAGIDHYEYCIDEINNGVCDTAWISTGTETSAMLSDLPMVGPVIWQVRAVIDGQPVMADETVWWKFYPPKHLFLPVAIR
jgi:hypothetical protein